MNEGEYIMISFENNKLNNLALPMSIVRMLTTINEYKGKQDLYKKQSPQILNTLKDVAIIQSAESSMLWHDGKNNLYIWLEYFLGVIIKAYKELEDRVGCTLNTKGSKSERVEMAIDGKLGYFTKNEIRTIYPDVGEATINRVFEMLRVEGEIEAVSEKMDIIKMEKPHLQVIAVFKTRL